MTHRSWCLALALLLTLAASARAAQFKIMTYNALNFPDALGVQRIQALRRAVNYFSPDVVVFQEVISQYGVQLLLDSVFNYDGGGFLAAAFHDGPDTDNALVYRSSVFTLMGAAYIPGPVRDIAEYRLWAVAANRSLYLYSLHLKASPEDSATRLQEAMILRAHLDSLGPNVDFMVAGDFNFYYDEGAYHWLTDSTADNDGRCFDPLAAPGYWHDNSAFAEIHTQSTRVDQLPDGGSSGGLDDRFDLMLCSQGLCDTAGLYLPPASYVTCGNDGEHLNQSINQGVNQAVPDSVADALYTASDHLPLLVTVVYGASNAIAEEEFQIWPNPMQTKARIVFPAHDGFLEGTVTINNVLGQRVFQRTTHDPGGLTVPRNNLPVGVYFVHLRIRTASTSYTYRSKMAVIR